MQRYSPSCGTLRRRQERAAAAPPRYADSQRCSECCARNAKSVRPRCRSILQLRLSRPLTFAQCVACASPDQLRFGEGCPDALFLCYPAWGKGADLRRCSPLMQQGVKPLQPHRRSGARPLQGSRALPRRLRRNWPASEPVFSRRNCSEGHLLQDGRVGSDLGEILGHGFGSPVRKANEGTAAIRGVFGTAKDSRIGHLADPAQGGRRRNA